MAASGKNNSGHLALQILGIFLNVYLINPCKHRNQESSAAFSSWRDSLPLSAFEAKDVNG